MRVLPLACAVLLAGCGATAVPAGPPVPRDAWIKPVGAAVTLDPLRSDDEYRRALFGTFVSATPENEMKWEVIHPARDRFDFKRADAVVNTMRAAGARVRGHPLVWDHQLPEWVREAPRDSVESMLRAHVSSLVSRYQGRVAQWDVVNEPLDDDGSLTQNVFAAALGERYIDIAFEEARRADPRARLFLNEIAAERGDKANALVALVRRLRGRGVPVDGVGLQNHATSDDFPTEADLRSLMRRLEGMVEITEMDVPIRRDASPLPAWRAAARACAAAPNCTGLTVWGVTDKRSWLGEAKRPTLFDSEGRAKPALRELRAALGRR